MSKLLKAYCALALLLSSCLFQPGCSQDGPVAQIIRTVISLTTGMDVGGFGLPPSGGGGPIGPSGGFGGIFNGGGSLPPASPWGGQPTQPLSVTGKEAYKELTEKYRWSLSGAYGDADLEKALWVARQFKQDEITTLKVRWTGGGGGGTAGLYSWGGGVPRITMYSRSCKVLCHEVCHHFSITHHTQRQRSVVREFLGNTWSGRPMSRSDIPTNYSLTNHKEWMAECGSIYRMKVKGRQGFNHWRSWNPSQKFRESIAKWYVD